MMMLMTGRNDVVGLSAGSARVEAEFGAIISGRTRSRPARSWVRLRIGMRMRRVRRLCGRVYE